MYAQRKRTPRTTPRHTRTNTTLFHTRTQIHSRKSIYGRRHASAPRQTHTHAAGTLLHIQIHPRTQKATRATTFSTYLVGVRSRRRGIEDSHETKAAAVRKREGGSVLRSPCRSLVLLLLGLARWESFCLPLALARSVAVCCWAVPPSLWPPPPPFFPLSLFAAHYFHLHSVCCPKRIAIDCAE